MEPIKRQVITKEGNTLAALFFKSESLKAATRPVIVTLHAFAGKKENRSIYEIATKANAHGFDSLCFDFSGHGESNGEITKNTVTKQMEEISEATKLVLDGRGIILVGNSFSAVTAVAFAKKNPRVKGLVLVSGRAHQEENAKYLSEHKEVSPGKFIDELFIEDYMKYKTIDILKDITVPTIIIHGEKDDIIPVADAKILFNAVNTKDKDLMIIKNGEHRFNDECRTEAVNSIYQFLEEHF
jgi:hypothetical protein